MPGYVLTLLGIVLGLIVIGGSLYLAVRPELRPKRRKPWLAKPSGNRHEADIGWMGDSGDSATPL